MLSPYVFLFSSLLYLCLSKTIHLALFSPLNQIPNAHFSIPFSRLWLLWIKWSGQENSTRLALHERLGPVVRLGPQELSVNCVENGVRTIYEGGFEKSAWYATAFQSYDSPFLFNILPNKPHTERKRTFASKYSKTHVQNSPELTGIFETIISLRVRPMIRMWAEHGTSVDVLSETKAFFMDMITAYTFGSGNGTNFIQNREERDYYFEMLRKSSEGFFWRTEFSGLAYWLHRCGIALKGVYHAKLEVERWCYDLCTTARHSPTTPISSTRSLPNPSVYTQLRSNLEASGLLGPVLDKTLAAETLDHLIASYDASGIIVTYLMYELSKSSALQQALRSELRTIQLPQASPIFPVVSLDKPPLLDALLLETLRLYASSPGPKPRCTPASGAHIGEFANIPPGTIVSAFGYGLHRNASVFFRPEEWLPERWLKATRTEKVEMMKWFWAFGSGTRMCIGSHYAMQTMKAFIASVYCDFETSVADDRGLEQMGAFIKGPVGNKLVLNILYPDNGKS